MHIALIGTGIMGRRMGANLLKAGHRLTVTNRTRANAQALIDQGATFAATPAAVAAAHPDAVLTMLSDLNAVEAVALGDHGFLSALPPGTLWLDSTTTHPAFARRMAQQAAAHHVRFVEGPVSGSKLAADAGQLVFQVGGDADDVAALAPLFEATGTRVNHLGPVGMGSALKLVLNHMLAVSMAAFAEGLALGEGLGLPRTTILDALLGGPLAPPAFTAKRDRVMTGNYTDPDFALQWMHKDLHMVALAAYDAHVPMLTSAAAKELFQLAAQHGHADADFSAVVAYLARIVPPPTQP